MVTGPNAQAGQQVGEPVGGGVEFGVRLHLAGRGHDDGWLVRSRRYEGTREHAATVTDGTARMEPGADPFGPLDRFRGVVAGPPDGVALDVASLALTAVLAGPVDEAAAVAQLDEFARGVTDVDELLARLYGTHGFSACARRWRTRRCRSSTEGR